MPECQKYKLDLPYPKVSGGPEPQTVQLLQEDYAGVTSEMTASSQYMYQHFLLNEQNQKLSEALECIAITEMRHKEMLGRTIARLGGIPAFAAANGYWCANFVNYEQDPLRMILANIQSEYAAIYNYRWHIQLISNDSVKQLLERIILDEELHIRIFNELLSSLGK